MSRYRQGPRVANEVSRVPCALCCWLGEVHFLYCREHLWARGILLLQYSFFLISGGLLQFYPISCTCYTSSTRGNDLSGFPSFCFEASGPTCIPIFPPRTGLGVMLSGLGHPTLPRVLSFAPDFLCCLCPVLLTGMGSETPGWTWVFISLLTGSPPPVSNPTY